MTFVSKFITKNNVKYRDNTLFVLILLYLFQTQNIFAISANIGNKMSYCKNTNIASDTTVKYISYCNDIILGFKSKDIIVKNYKYESLYLKNVFFKMTLLNSNSYEYETGMNSDINVVECYDNDSVRVVENISNYTSLVFNDTLNTSKLYYSIFNNKYRINFDVVNASYIQSIKYKLTNLDSIRYDIDSNIVLFTKLNSVSLERVNVKLYDSTGIDSLSSQLKFIVSNDTLSISTSGLDTNKRIVTSYNEKEQKNVYIDYIQSEENNDQNSLLVSNSLENNERYFLVSNSIPQFYKYSNYSTTISFDTLRRVNVYFLEKRANSNNLLFAKIVCYSSSTLTPVFKKMTTNSSNEIVVIGYTKTPLLGVFTKIMKDSSGYNTFQNNYFNGFIFKANINASCIYANYIVFKSNNNNNVYINDYAKIGRKDFIVGVADSLTNKDSLVVNIDKTKSAKYTTFLMNYHHSKDNTSEYILVSSNNNTDYISFNSIDYTYDDKKNIIIGMSGTTNSATALDTAVWNKSGIDNCNIIMTTNYFIDTIYKVYKIEGNSHEGKYFTKQTYHFNNTKLCYNSVNELVNIALTNSSTFNTNDSTQKNSKLSANYCTYIAKIDTNKQIKNLLFVNSTFDQTLQKVIQSNNNYFMAIQSKSNNYQLPLVRDTVVSDTLSDTTKINTAIVQINDSLSLTYNTTTSSYDYNPVWLTYFDNSVYDCLISDFDVENKNINIVGRIKGLPSYANSYVLSNGDATYYYFDSLLCKIYFGVIQ